MLQLRKHEGKRGRTVAETGEALRFSVVGLLAGLACCVVGTAAAGDSANFKTLRLEGNGVRWQTAAKGQQRVLSYAIVSKDVEFAALATAGG